MPEAQGAHERLDDVDDGDRLHPAVHPRRDRVHRHPLADLAHDLEARRPRAGDDRRAQGERRRARAGAGEDALDLEAGGDVLGQLVLGHVGHEPAEVDDGAHAGAARRRRPSSRPTPGRGVAKSAPLEAVDEVEDRVDALDRRVDGVGVPHVHPDELDLVGPPPTAGLLGVGHRGPHVVAVAQQPRDESAADVPGGAGDEDGHGLNLGAHEATPGIHAGKVRQPRAPPRCRRNRQTWGRGASGALG